MLKEGEDFEEYLEMLRDALNEMIQYYQQLNEDIPVGNALIEQFPIEVEHVGQAT